jgi:PAS domain S-box-containing protein
VLKSTHNNPAAAQQRADDAVEQQEALIAIDAEHHVIAWNRAAEAMLGWSMSDVMGRTLSEIFGEDQERNQAAAAADRNGAHDRQWPGRTGGTHPGRTIHPDGSGRNCHARSAQRAV